MGAAVIQVSVFSCSATTPSGTSGETTGLCFNMQDSRSLTSSPIAIPTTGATSTGGTNFSWTKYLALEVVTTGTTTISNRMVARSSAPPAGLILHWACTSAFVTPALASVANTSADDKPPWVPTTDGQALTTTYVAYSTYDVVPVAGRNGGYAKIALGVSSTYVYTGGPGSAIVLPNLLFQYDEA